MGEQFAKQLMECHENVMQGVTNTKEQSCSTNKHLRKPSEQGEHDRDGRSPRQEARRLRQRKGGLLRLRQRSLRSRTTRWMIDATLKRADEQRVERADPQRVQKSGPTAGERTSTP